LHNCFPTAVTVIAAAVFCSPVAANIYYVDVEHGSDDNSGTAIGSAWAHLPGTVGAYGFGWATLVDGDTVVVKGGTTNNVQVKFTSDFYNGIARFDSIKVLSGHLNNPAWGTGQAIIDGQKMLTFGLWFTGSSSSSPLQGITLDGFEIRNIAPGGVPGFDPHSGSSCVLVGGSYQAHFFTIRRCYLHDAFRTIDDTGNGIEAEGHDFLAYWNTIGPNIGTKGIEVSGFGGAVSNNFISGTGDHCIALNRATNFDVCNNLVRQAGPQVHSPTFCISVALAAFNDVWNNILFDSENKNYTQPWSSGIGVYGSSSTLGNHFYHNTLYRLQNGGGVGSPITVGDSGNPINQLFENNLVLNCTNAAGNSFMVYVAGKLLSTRTTIKFNCIWDGVATHTVCGWNDGDYHYATVPGFSQPGITFQNNVQIDPLITGGPWPTGLDSNYHPNTTYFKPTFATSPKILISSNKLLGDPAYGYNSDPNKFCRDILGVKRTGWSMGAYEMSPVILPTPTGLRAIPGS
jgi:hypothetical protein